MESLLKLLEQLQGMAGVIEELQLKLENAQVELEAEKKLSYDEGFGAGSVEGKKIGYDEGYAKGFEDGKNSVPQPEPSDKIYSQVELDQAVAGAVEPLQMKIAELELAVSEIPGKIEAAKAELKAEIMQKYMDAQASESESEKSFEEFLK